jgi:two-component system, NarL family, response regulator YdfI
VIRVGIAASSAIVRAGLAALLRAGPDIEIVPDTAEGPPPDVLVTYLEGPEEEVPAPANPSTALIVLADDPQPPWTAEALRAGVRAILPRELTANEIVAAVGAAAAGLIVLHPQAVEQVVADPVPNNRALPEISSHALTQREIEVLRMLAEGLGNKTIAWRLGISEHTVKFHVAAIMGKLHAASRTEAVTQGIRRGLILL